MPFEAGAEQYLGQALTEAAQRMADTGAVDPGRIREAERNTERLVDAMAAVARELGFGEFHEPTFFGARDRLCPGLWPFC